MTTSKGGSEAGGSEAANRIYDHGNGVKICAENADAVNRDSDASARTARPSAENTVRVSFVIPAYNEADRIADTLRRMRQYFEKQGYSYEIIVVDDGSSDGTAKVVSDFFPWVRLLTYSPNRGKGYAVKAGILAATGRYRFFYDADGSTPIEELEKMWPHFSRGADIVVGSRSLPESDVQVRQSFFRQSMGRTYNKFVKLILNEKMIDTQCGFKGFTSASAAIVFSRQRMNRFVFDAELLFVARKFGLNVVELPVIWRNSPHSRVRIIGDSLRMLRDLIRIRLRDWAGGYK